MAEDQQQSKETPSEVEILDNTEETREAQATEAAEVPDEAGSDEAVSEAEDVAEETTEAAAEAETTAEDAAEEAPAAEAPAAEAPAAEAAADEEAAAEAAVGDETEAAEAEADEEPASGAESAGTSDTAAEEAPAAEASAEPGATDEGTGGSDGAVSEAAGSSLKGYTGEIIGSVYKLEDLQEDEPEDRAIYDALTQMIEQTLTNVSEHEIVTGRIVSIGEKDVVIDIGFKSDGIVTRNEFSAELKPGDEVEVYLERIEDYQGQLILSKTKADKVKRWRRIEDAYEGEAVLEGVIVRRIKGGMIVELFDGVEAFLPGSQIDVRPVRDFDAYLEKRMEFKIVKLNPANENIVVSHKALIEKDLEAQREKILSTMEPGQILEGTVKNITDFGVFIDLGGVDGLLHITDLSWGRVSHPSELVSLDDKMNVVVLDYDKERQRISLGLKQLQPHPWENINEKFTTGDVVEGKVVSITDYGAFVELEKGIEGLVHISEMSWTEHIKHPSQMVSLGQMVSVKILNIDHEGKKISLGMKQLMPDPWEDITDRYPPGTVLRGKVRNITNFGVFVEIEPGIDGLVHISDLSWTKKIRHPSEMVKKGQALDVVVLNIDVAERRISLGHKQVETNPWNQFAKVYNEGTETEGKIVRVDDRGVTVLLGMDVEGFIPASELQDRDVSNSYKEGQELNDLRVIRFDAGQKEIILSQVAKERDEARAEREAVEREKRAERTREREDVRRFQKTPSSSGSATGPTTLGELSGLADLKARLQAAEGEETAAPAAEAETREAPEAEAEEAPEAVEAEAEETPEAEADVEAEETPEAEAEEAPEAEETPEAEADVEAEVETVGAEEAAEEAEAEETPEAEAEEVPEAEAEETPEAEADVEAEVETVEAEEAAEEAEAEEEAEDGAQADIEAEADEEEEEEEK